MQAVYVIEFIHRSASMQAMNHIVLKLLSGKLNRGWRQIIICIRLKTDQSSNSFCILTGSRFDQYLGVSKSINRNLESFSTIVSQNPVDENL
jgi:hypothetical protein